MILRLSPRQVAGCRHWLTDRHREFFNPVKVSPKRLEVAMPPAGWRSLAGILLRHAFRPSGRSDGRAPAGTRSALHAISRGQARLEGHPAMRREMVKGYSGDVLTAWKIDDSSYSPYPQPGEEMVVMMPMFYDKGVFAGAASGTMFVEDVTAWEPLSKWGDMNVSGLFLNPADHEGWT